MSLNIAFLGLGVMGYPMAGHLSKAGYAVTVYNRTTSKAKDWTHTYAGSLAETPALAAVNADIVFACVGNDDDLTEVCLGADGAFQNMKPGSLFVDHTTASAKVACLLASKATEKGFSFMDAPVSGGQAGAENGVLTIMLGGTAEDYEKVSPLLNCYAKKSRLMGQHGSGQLTKMVNQICIAGLVQGLSEGINFAQQAGLDPVDVVDVISEGAAGSWQMVNRTQTMKDDHFDHGFAIDWMRKDLAIVFDEANKNGAELPITKIIDGFYAELQAMGGQRWDTSALIKRLNQQ